jgi:Uma2 family endonuclease
MIASRHPVRYSFAEYLAHEEASNTKHEFLDGQIYAMAGGSPEHSALIASVNGQLWSQLRNTSCSVHMSDLRVRVLATGLATYPDIPIVCGGWERDPENRNTIINPKVIVEVLSPRTEEYDRGEKFEHYKKIPSLRQYVPVAHDRREIEVWTRGADDTWTQSIFGPGKVASLSSIEASLDVDAAYNDAQERR